MIRNHNITEAGIKHMNLLQLYSHDTNISYEILNGIKIPKKEDN